MNETTKIRVLTGLVAVLVLLNISLLGYLCWAPHGGGDRRPGPPRDGHGPGGLVIRELKFDDAQQKEFERLRDEHHSAMMRIGEMERGLHDRLFNSLSEGGTASALSDSLIGEIINGEKQKETITYRHLGQVRQLCRPGQQKIFDGMIAKAMARKGEDGPPPREDRP